MADHFLSGPQVITIFFMLSTIGYKKIINAKMPTNVTILTFISMINTCTRKLISKVTLDLLIAIMVYLLGPNGKVDCYD